MNYFFQRNRICNQYFLYDVQLVFGPIKFFQPLGSGIQIADIYNSYIMELL